ncbi:MAG: hypothetical protein ABSD21_07525 [Rhizomicrobium sp.]|jgi:hypothetical protein
MEGREIIAGNKRTALTIWGVCVCLLLGPSLLVWIVRGAAYATHCQPGPELCHGMMLGGGLRDALALAWSVSTNTFFLIAVSITATLAAFTARHPLLGTLSLLLLPILALVLPMIAVLTARYGDCAVNNDGIGNCTLWGAQMGMSFHTAASVPDIIYGLMPFSFALTLMLGLLGWFFARPRKHQSPQHLSAQMRHFGDE